MRGHIPRLAVYRASARVHIQDKNAPQTIANNQALLQHHLLGLRSRDRQVLHIDVGVTFAYRREPGARPRCRRSRRQDVEVLGDEGGREGVFLREAERGQGKAKYGDLRFSLQTQASAPLARY